MSKLKTALRQPLAVWLWLAPCWFLLGFSRLAILTVPFKRLAPLLGAQAQLDPITPVCTPRQERRALAVDAALRIASRYTPWTSNCFPQAMTARIIFGALGIPYALYFGTKRNRETKALEAHAWLASGKVTVGKVRSFREFTPVGVFVSR